MRRRKSGEAIKVWGPLLALAALGFLLAFLSIDPPAPKRLTLAAGAADGAYHAFAEQYRAFLAREGFTLEILETAGSVDNLARLEDGTADIALLQGGIAPDTAHDTLESIASAFLEPVWVFHRRDVAVATLVDLRGHRVAVGPPGSGSRVLAEQLLAANGIGAEDTERLPLGGMAAATALEAGEADAAIFVSSPQAAYVRHLLRAPGVGLLSFRRVAAYGRLHPFLTDVVLDEGAVDLAADLPPQDVVLLAAAASLVARQELHPDLVLLLLKALEAVHGNGDLFDRRGTFPSIDLVDLPLNRNARQYLVHGPSFLHRFLSFRVATTLDRMKILLLPLITLLIPIFKVAPPLYRWRIRRKIYRWYEDLRLVDEVIYGGRREESLDDVIATVRQLEREITEVSVPLSYMEEYYHLRVHTELVLEKLTGWAKEREEKA